RTRGRAKRAPEPFEQYQPPTRKTQPSLREGAGFSEGRCAKQRTRTSTGITPLAPQGNSQHEEAAISAHLESIEVHPNAPENTHSRVVPGADELRGVAIRMLRLTALQEEIPRDQADAFAKGALATSEVGRLALRVLEG